MRRSKHGPMNNRLAFGGDSVHDPVPGTFKELFAYL